MRRIIALAIIMTFLWTGISFAENWVMFFDGEHLKSYFDSDRVKKVSGQSHDPIDDIYYTPLEKFDYWTRDVLTKDFLGIKEYLFHQQIELRKGDKGEGDGWWKAIIEVWQISSDGTAPKYFFKGADWHTTSQESPDGVALINGLRKYAR